MPRLVHKQPAYCHHVKSNRGRVCVAGKYHYLPGAYGSAQSQEAYWALIRRLENNEAIDGSSKATTPDSGQARDSVAPSSLTVAELVEKYREYAQNYYRQQGEPTGESVNIKYAVQPLLDVCFDVLVSEFRPRHLKEVRQVMVAKGWSRRHVNASIRRIRRMFVWGVEEEIVPQEVAGSIMMVKALREGRDPSVREKSAVKAVKDETIDKILPFVSMCVADVIQFLRLTGCRPSEFTRVTVESIDRSDPECWKCVLTRHKTAYKGRRRTLLFPQKCQAILMRWIVKAGSGKIFPLSLDGLQTAIARACKKADVEHFSPNQIRHSVATAARKKCGLEGAQHLLGHASANTTEIYAELDENTARQVAMAIG